MTQFMTTAAARRLDDLPTPPGTLPGLGNLHQFDVPRLHQVFERWHASIGGPFMARMGPKKIFVSADPGQLQTVLRDRPGRYRRVRQIEACLAEIGANGVFSVEGAAWSAQRRLVMSALNSTHFRGFFPTLHTITARLHRRWKAAAARGEIVEMTQDLVRYTVDVTTALVFGEDPNTLESDGDIIQRHLSLVFPMLMSRINAPLPYWRYLKLPRDRRFEHSMAAIHAHAEMLVAHARQRMREEPPATPRNLLEALLSARDQPDSGLDDDAVKANVLTLLLAGEDTTAHTLAWSMFYLAQDMDCQQQLHGLAREVLGDAEVCPEHDRLRRLDDFESAAHEATRLKPIVPLIFLEPVEDVVLDGIALPAGTPLFFLLRPAMLDDRHFAAASTYDPQRWAPEHGGRVHDARAYVQFGAGPRVCPGRHLAGVEIRLVLSMLLRGFKVELAADPATVKEVMAFTMMPSRMPLRLTPRLQ